MKKILIAAAAAGLISLAACTSAPGNATQDNAAETNEANADYYQGLADNSANAVVANQSAAADAAEANASQGTENSY